MARVMTVGSLTLATILVAGGTLAQQPAAPPAAQPAPAPAGAQPPPPAGYPAGYPAAYPAYADAPEAAPPEDAPREAKNSVYAEGLGPGLLYSVNYDRFLIEELAARIGFGYVSLTASASAGGTTQVVERASLLTVPITVSYLGIGSKKHMFELGGGVTVAHVSGSVDTLAASSEGEATTFFGTALFGYRLQPPDGGFQFRVGGSPLLYSGIDTSSSSPERNKRLYVLPWGYLSLGGTF